MAYQLMVGFDKSVPEAAATAAAIDEWRGALARDGWVPVGEPFSRVVHTPTRDELGEYAVEVTGERVLADDPTAPTADPQPEVNSGDV